MPLLRRKRVERAPTPDLDGVEDQVWMMPVTKEIFATYDDYIERYFFYRQKVFQCETTGKINLNFFEAMLSELQESNLIESQFPDALKGRVLKHVQFQTIGRMDHLVDHVYDRFRDVFYAKEEAICDLWGDRYKGIIMERRYSQTGANPFPEASGREKIVARQSTGNLSPDGRWKYWYFLRITDPRLSRDKDVEIRGDYLSRDRLLWSKALLKKYLREATTREPYIGAPWMIKPKPAKKYGLPLELTPELQMQKEEHFASLGKKKRPADAPEGEVKKPKLMIKYPIEDLELPSNEDLTRPTPSQDITVPQNCMESFLIVWNFLQVFGKPLGISPIVLDDFEGCLRHDVPEMECVMIAEIHAVLLNTIIKDRKSTKSGTTTAAMALAPALNKASKDGLSSVDVDSSSALSVLSGDEDTPMNGNGIDHHSKPNLSSEVMQRFVKVWDAKYLAANDDREGWENVLVGCLASLGGYETIPNLDGILQHLTANEDEDEAPKSKSKSRKVHSTGPSEQYPTLSIADKLQILEFLVDLAGSAKAIKLYMEECELQLTELRKERIEVGRAKKKLIADREALDGGTVNEVKKEDGVENGKSESLSSDTGSDDDMDNAGEDEAEDDDDYEDEDEDASGNGRGRTLSRQARLRKQQAERERAEKQRIEQLAAQRAAAREKTAGAKQIAAERRRLDEEEYRLQRKEDQIEREFRRHSCARSRPLGKDRFFNRYWWFDGIGAPLQGAGGAPLYGAGRLFIQGPTDIDAQQYPPEISLRREIEEGASGILPNGHWAFYTDPEDIEQLKHWLNTKGHRELALTNVIRKYEQYIVAGMRKRNTELANLLTRPSEARRSSRAKTHNSSMSLEPYMSWSNKMIK